ncbi:MAG: HAMP domain-containing histidine kinase [Actinomycetia bacterium]|nr:HAMP domain-containing histidine kinase [Actinomycetes bacterium]
MAVLVVAVALAITVVVLRQVLLTSLDTRIDRALSQEGSELIEFLEAQPRDSDVSEHDHVHRALIAYLETNVTDPDEVMVAVQDGRPIHSSEEPLGDITPFLGQFEEITTPEFADAETDQGPVRLFAQPVVSDEQQVGLIAVAWFEAPERAVVARTVFNAALVSVAALGLATVLAWIIAGRVLRPIGLLALTAREITEGDLSRRLPVQGTDEIASLIAGFNSMVDRLETALAAQRTFLDDAGHELRTPLTIMVGHLDVASGDPEGMQQARGVLLGEAERMSRIVEDLLLLARAEQPDLLAVGPIDVDDWFAELFQLVESLGPQQWVVDDVPIGVVVADVHKLTQAVLNLATNATRHTPDTGSIHLGASLSDDWIRIWVRDTGEGIDRADHQQVFERFRRGESQRSPGGSAGLGLSIVATIAQAHNGHVEVQSTPGEGATFTLLIPVTPVIASSLDRDYREDQVVRWVES